jgi:hypothetical protein
LMTVLLNPKDISVAFRSRIDACSAKSSRKIIAAARNALFPLFEDTILSLASYFVSQAVV